MIADQALQQRLAGYRSAENTLRFALTKPMPLELIAEVVQLLVRERAVDRV